MDDLALVNDFLATRLANGGLVVLADNGLERVN